MKSARHFPVVVMVMMTQSPSGGQRSGYVVSRNGRRRRSGRVFLIDGQAHVFADFALGFAPPEIAFGEIFHVGRMDGPVVALAVGAASGFDETIVQTQIVPDAVAPAGPARPEISVIVQYVLIDVAEHQFLVSRTEDGHRY